MLESALTKTWSIGIGRRQFLVGVASLSAATGLPDLLWAQAAPHSFKQGDFEVTVLSDGVLTFPAGVMAPDAPIEEVKALLEAAGQLDGDNATPGANAVLIRAGAELILVDTGSGSGFQPTVGKLPESLKAAGVAPGDITRVVFTHGHLDHIGGTVAEDGSVRYPNAAYHVAAKEFDFWMDPTLFDKMPKEMHGFITGAQQNFGAVKDKMTMMKPGDEIVTGIRLLETPGHTPGHGSIEVVGGDGLIIGGDAAVNTHVFFAHPEWRFGFDADPAQAVANRKALLDRASADKIKMIGYHWLNPGVGFVEKKGDAYQFAPAT